MSETVPVAVCVRIRPFTAAEQDNGSCENCITCSTSDQLQLIDGKLFRFDRVFPPHTTQTAVYNEVVSPLVVSCLEGINCTVFAYGQTGSGKTYTLGSEGMESHHGIIPAALSDIFDMVKKKVESGDITGYYVRISYVEVYKEEMRDLLADDMDGRLLNIREDENGRTTIIGITEEKITLVEEALHLLETGNAVRVTSATEMNKHSSRSHVMFILTLIQNISTADTTGEQQRRLVSKFHFVDLAGSERVNRTHNKGERFKESIHINGGLLALGNVINALSDPKKRPLHIPYRDSKITRLLKDSLGGNTCTVMITCLSPCYKDLPESLNTLKYAKRARNIKNRPVVNHDPQMVEVLAMREEIQCLRAELHKAREIPLVSSISDERIDTVKMELQKLYITNDELNLIIKSTKEQLSNLMKQLQQMENVQEVLPLIQEVDRMLAGNSDYTNRPSTVSGCVDIGTNTDSIKEKATLALAFDTIESLRKEIERCKSDLLADEEIFGEKEAEFVDLKDKYNLLEEENVELKSQINDLKQKVIKQEEDQISDNHLINEIDINERHRVLHNALYNKVDISSVLHEQTHESCDIALCQMTSLLVSCDRGKESHDDHVMVSNPLPTPSQSSTETVSSQEKLHDTERKLLNEQHKLRSLTLKIKLKEELIRELIKNNNTVQCLNSVYQKKINSLENESEELKKQITAATVAAASRGKIHQKVSDQYSTEATKDLLHMKLKETESKLASLRKRQRETLRVLQTSEMSSGRRVAELEKEVERLREKQTKMRHKLREEGESKKMLEREMEYCKRKVAELTDQTEKQSHVLRIKTEKVVMAQRKLLHHNKRASTANEMPVSTEKEKWLKGQVSKMSEEREALNNLQQELSDRELLVKQHETLLKEKMSLERKRDILNQQSCQSSLHLSLQLNVMSDLIKKKQNLRDSLEEPTSVDLQHEVDVLMDKHKQIKEKKQIIEEQLANGVTLTKEEEARIQELQDQIEVLENSLRLKTNSLSEKVRPESFTMQQWSGLQEKISQFSLRDVQTLLVQSIVKISELEDELKTKDKRQRQLKIELNQKNDAVDVLKQSLTQLRFDKEQKLDKYHKRHVQDVQMLLDHVVTTHSMEDETVLSLKRKIESLEKDLFYYKKTSRDMKRALKEMKEK